MKRKIILIIVTLSMLAVTLAPLAMTENVEAAGESWLAGYSYRRPVTVYSTSATTNLTEQVVLNSTNFDFTLAQSDGDDIRFTASNGYQELSYFRRYYSATYGKAYFDVKIPTVASGVNILYVYYGNSTVSTTSNGSAVYSTYDSMTLDENRNVTTNNFCGEGAMLEKADVEIFTPSGSYWYEDNGTIMGCNIVYDEGGTGHMAYGSLANSTHAVINGMSDTTQPYASFLRYSNNPIINHTGNPEEPYELKVMEPNFVHWINDTYQKKAFHDSDYHMLFTALNSTQESICHAYKDTFDAAWTVTGAVISGTAGEWNESVRSPCVWSEGANDFRCMFAASGDGNNTWDIGYANASTVSGPWYYCYDYPIINHTSYGWYNASIIPLDIWKNSTTYNMLVAGMQYTGSEYVWRLGIAYSTDADLKEWTIWAGITPLGDDTDFDEHSINYGTWCIGTPGESDEYSMVYYTGRNDSIVTQIGYGIMRNTTWNHDGQSNSCFCNMDGGIRIDTNNTMLSRSVGVANTGNVSATASIWYKSASANNAPGIFVRASDDSWSGRDYYSVDMNANNAYLGLAADNVYTQLDNEAVYMNGTTEKILRMTGYGSTLTGYYEDCALNMTATVTGTDTNYTTGRLGVLSTNTGAVQFDDFSTLASSGVSTSSAVGGQTTYGDFITPDAGVAPSGGGSSTDTTTQLPPPPDDTFIWSLESIPLWAWSGIITLIAVGIYVSMPQMRKETSIVVLILAVITLILFVV